jgi:anti-anti-sigma factor
MSVIAAVSETGAAMPRGGAVVGAPVEIDIATAREFEREAMRVLDASDGRIVIDLSATTFMDVSGARVLARVTRRANELGGCVSLAAVGPGARRLLDLVEPAWTSLLEAQDDPAFEQASVGVSTDSSGHPEADRDLRVIGCAFDGSPESFAALRWAAGLARRCGARLESLIVLQGVAFGGASTAGAIGYQSANDTLHRMLTKQLNTTLTAVGDAGDTSRVPSGDPAAELIKASAGLDLLVLGSRGRGRLKAALLGSVSGAVTNSARCPVVVVPRDSESGESRSVVLHGLRAPGPHPHS